MSVDSLNAALSGLRAAQRQIGLISSNIANATTPGYTRKILPQSDFVVNGESIGVRTANIRRSVNESLQVDLYSQTSLVSASKVQLKYLDQIQLFHGDPNAQGSIPHMFQQIQSDFLALADDPVDVEQLNLTVGHAQQLTGRINQLSELYTRLRNEAQTEMEDSVKTVNDLLKRIERANNQIARNANIGAETASLEDERDQALTELSEQMDISYYPTGDGRIYVQLQNGDQLVGNEAATLVFNPSTMGVGSYYPASVKGIYFDSQNGGTSEDVEITGQIMGGKLGGLLELRDDLLPRYQAELDEFAQKISQRFDEQGLRLFGDNHNAVPANVAPPANTNYTGYSLIMQVNDAIVANPNLLRLGTEGETIPSGSARIIDRINTYAFGTSYAQRALGNVDLDNTGVATLFATLGIDTQATVQGIKNIQALSTLDADTNIVPGTNDTFTIQLGAGAPSNIVIGAGDTAADLVSTINTAFPGLASLSATGRLVLKDDENIIIGAGTLGSAGLEALGLAAGTTNAKNPSFTVQLDDGLVTPVEIAPTDTSTQLLAKLNLIPGITATLTSGGFLQIDTDYGAQIHLSDGLGKPLDAMGIAVTDLTHAPFRTANLGPGANITSSVNATDTSLSYALRLVSTQSNETTQINKSFTSSDVYRASLEEQIRNESGVNLDEEMGNLIAIQRIYGANAKVINTSIQLLNELLDAI